MYSGVIANCNMAGLGLVVAERGGLGDVWGDTTDTADPFIDRGRKLSFSAPSMPLLEYMGDRCTMGGVVVLRGTFRAVAYFSSFSSCSLFLTLVTTA